ncbi:MAG: TIGR02444 family protein [Alphaproteobacteria bacterium]|nr:TIGR02444 family protein [Alphaproteobacteria bacterium]
MSDAVWDFAVALYGRPGVREACLELQDRRGADVIVLLALVQAATAGAAEPGDDRLRRAQAAIAPWHAAAVQPLRSLRRALKGWRFERGAAGADARAEAARQEVAAAERAAERAELSAFVDALADRCLAGPPSTGPRRDGLAAAADSLASYWRVAGLGLDAGDRAALALILAEAFPSRAGESEGAVARAFNS